MTTSSSQTSSLDRDAPIPGRTLIVVILIAGAFVSVLNQTLMLVAIPPIMRDFGAEASLAQWVTTAFMLTSGLFIPISAVLIDRFSNRALFMAAQLTFVLGTALGAMAVSFEMLLLARIIQGAAAGIIMPMIQTLIMSLYPIEKRGQAMGLVGLVIAFAPALGPTLSGWIVDHLSWRYLFVLILPIALLVLTATFAFMKNVTPRRAGHIDRLSVVLSTLGWGGLLYGFSLAGAAGWGHPQVLSSLVVGAVALGFFLRRQGRLTTPLLDIRVFDSPVFSLTTGLSVLCFILLIGTQTLIPLYVQDGRGLSALVAGLVLLPGAVVMGLMSPIAGRLFDRFGIHGLAIFGFGLLALAMGLLAGLGESTSMPLLAGLSILHMLGVSSVLMPLVTAGINSLPRELIAHATAMNNTLRMVGGSIGTAILVTVMSTTLKAGVPAAARATAVIDGIRLAFGVALGLALLGLVVAFFLRRFVLAERRRG